MLAPALCAVPAAWLDRGPGGVVRATLFPAAVVVFDPFLWACAWNSLAVATAVTCGSLVLGVALARVVVRGDSAGGNSRRPGLRAVLVIPPLVGALGLRIVYGSSGPGEAAGSGSGGRED